MQVSADLHIVEDLGDMAIDASGFSDPAPEASVDGYDGEAGRVLHLVQGAVEESPEISFEPWSIPLANGPNTPEVLELIQSGCAEEIILYEFMQNAADYHNGSAGIRIIYETADGGEETVLFDGRAPVDRSRRVLAIEVFNAKGFSPSRLYRHEHGDDGGAYTRGEHGRGAKVAIAKLVDDGMTVDVQSFDRGRLWQATCEKGIDQFGTPDTVLYNGDWGQELADEELAQTVFRINSPNTKILDALDNASQFFLDANPAYRDAVLVDFDDETPDLYHCPIAGTDGALICLSDIFPDHELGQNRRLYVDGLALQFSYYEDRRSVFTWGGVGLSKKGPFQLARSKSSTHLEGGKPSMVVGYAVRQWADRVRLKAAMELALANPKIQYLEFPEKPYYEHEQALLNMSDETKRLVASIWEEMYEDQDVLYTTQESLIKWHKGPQEVILVNAGLAYFLQAAGLSSLEDVSGGAQVQEVRTSNIQVPWMKEEGAFYDLMERVVEAGGAPAFFPRGESPASYLEIRFSEAVATQAALKGETDSSGGKLIRLLAIFAHVWGVGFDGVAREGDTLHRIDLSVSNRGNHYYSTEVALLRCGLERAAEWGHEELRNNETCVRLSGGLIGDLDADAEEDAFEVAAQEARNRRRQLPVLKHSHRIETVGGGGDGSSRSEAVYTAREVAKMVEGGEVGFRGRRGGASPLHSSVGNGLSFPTAEAYANHLREDIGLDLAESLMPSGHYGTTIGTRFVYNPSTRRCYWEAPDQFATMDIPNEAPENPTSKIVLRDRRASQALVVLDGNRISSLDVDCVPGTRYEIRRNVVTGAYMLHVECGTIRRLTYYTEPDLDDALRSRRPTSHEREDYIEDNPADIDYGIYDLIPYDQRECPIARLNAVQRAWAENFVASYDPKYDEQACGDSRLSILSHILSRKIGQCNIFATGKAVLLRHWELPARQVGGFFVSGGHVRSHAWTQVYIAGQWVLDDEGYDQIERDETVNDQIWADSMVSGGGLSARSAVSLADLMVDMDESDEDDHVLPAAPGVGENEEADSGMAAQLFMGLLDGMAEERDGFRAQLQQIKERLAEGCVVLPCEGGGYRFVHRDDVARELGLAVGTAPSSNDQGLGIPTPFPPAASVPVAEPPSGRWSPPFPPPLSLREPEPALEKAQGGILTRFAALLAGLF